MNTFNFKYIFPVSKTIQHYCSCVINRNIRTYLDKKKLKVINKIVHIFLEESITNAKQNYTQKIKNNHTFFINDTVLVNMGKGVVQDIRKDGIIKIKLELGLNTTSIGYYKKDDVTLVLDDKEVISILLESSEETSEEYSSDFVEESSDESSEKKLESEDTSMLSYITHTLYNVKKYIVG